MRLPLGWAAIVCVMALSGIAQAQIAGDEFGIERFRLATSGGMLDVDSATVGPHLDYGAGLAIGFAHDPLVIYDDQMAAVDPLVERRVTTDLVGSLSLYGRVQLGVGAKIIGYQSGTGGLTVDSLPKGGLGDLRLVPKVMLARRDRYAVAIVPELTVPGGSARGWLREDGATFAPAAAVSVWSDSGLAATVNIGYRIKPRVRVAGLVSDDEAFARLGLAYPTSVAMLWWSTSIAAPLVDASQNQVALETLLGIERPINDRIIVFGAGGIGLANGFGTPDWRALLGVEIYKPYPKPKIDPNPYKGEHNEEAKPIEVPVVIAKAKLTGTVTSTTGQPIPGAHVVIGSTELAADDNGHFEVELDAGVMTVDAVADGYETGMAQITIAPGATGDVTVALQRKVRQGQLRGQVLSFAGKPVLGATITVGDKSATSDADGNYSIDLPAGSFDVTIEAAGFQAQNRKVNIKLDAVTVLNADMRGAK